MNIKENVLYILKKRGMTQTDLANKMGVSKQSIQHYLTGKITLEVLQKMAIAMNTTMATIVSESPLVWKDDPVPTRDFSTNTKLVCPHCGKEINIVAK